MRDTGLIFERDCTSVDPARRIDPTSLFNFLLAEWNAGLRVYDRAWADRTDRIQNRLNGFLLSLRHPFDEAEMLHGDGMEFFIADRIFDRDLFLSAEQEGYSEVAAPLLRAGAGKTSVTIVEHGYRALVGARELEFGKANEIDFEGDPKRLSTPEVDFVIGKGYVASVHYHPLEHIGEMRTLDARLGDTGAKVQRDGIVRPAISGRPVGRRG